MNKFQKQASKLALIDIRVYNLDIKSYKSSRNFYLKEFERLNWSFEKVKDFALFSIDINAKMISKERKVGGI